MYALARVLFVVCKSLISQCQFLPSSIDDGRPLPACAAHAAAEGEPLGVGLHGEARGGQQRHVGRGGREADAQLVALLKKSNLAHCFK